MVGVPVRKEGLNTVRERCRRERAVRDGGPGVAAGEVEGEV